MSNAKETFTVLANDGKFAGPRARRDAVVATLHEIADIVDGVDLSIAEVREGLEAIAFAYPGALAVGSGDPGAPAMLGRARTVREMFNACKGYRAWVIKLDAIEACAGAWETIASAYASREDERSQAIARTWSREARFLRAAYEVLDV